MKIVFIGKSPFEEIILRKLIENNHKVCLIIAGTNYLPNGCLPFVSMAKEYKIPFVQTENVSEIRSKIQKIEPDLILVSEQGKILPKEILEIPKYGCLGIHFSLLPYYRGAFPIQYTILNEEEKSGITIFIMDDKLDHGPIILQKTIEIKKKETSTGLFTKLCETSADLLLITLIKWTKGLIKSTPQDDSEATYVRTLGAEDGRLNWRKPAQLLEREVRAFEYWPGSFTIWKRRTGEEICLKILKARVYESVGGLSYPIGKTLVVPQNDIAVQCGEGFLIKGGDLFVIEKLKIEGKEEMNSEDFLRKYPDFIGTVLK